MTLTEAQQRVGTAVVYRSHPDAPMEQGVITSVNQDWVFVRFGADIGSKATRPDHLSPMTDWT